MASPSPPAAPTTAAQKRARSQSRSGSPGQADNDGDDNSTTPRAKLVHLSSPPARPLITCSLPPHDAPQSFTSYAAFDAHHAAAHANRCLAPDCSANLPTPHLLALHLAERHDPIVAARRERGEKVFACLVEGCAKVCGDWRKRRAHLVDKHGYPRDFDFLVVDHGIEGRRSLLRTPGRGRTGRRGRGRGARGDGSRGTGQNTRGGRTSDQSQTNVVSSKDDGDDADHMSDDEDDDDGDDDDDDDEDESNEYGTENEGQDDVKQHESHDTIESIHSRGRGRGGTWARRGFVTARGTATAAHHAPSRPQDNDSNQLDSLALRLSALSFVPPAVRMGRGGGSRGRGGGGRRRP